MGSIREVQRVDRIAYEARWRDNGKFRQRTFTVKREAERFVLRVENDLVERRA